MTYSKRVHRSACVAAVISCLLLLSACDEGSGPSQFSIGGTVSALAPGESVNLADNGAHPLSISANGAFKFPTAVTRNGSYSVTVATQPKGQICTVSNGSGAGLTAAVTNVTVTCSSDTYPLSGTLAGLPGGDQLVLQNNGADALRLSANGPFKFATPLAYDGSYAVTVSTQLVDATCSVSHGMGAGVTAAVAGVAVLCSPVTYTISGTVSGLATGVQVTLDDNAADALTVAANGGFTFATPVVAGGSYAVTVGTQPSGETCTVSSGQGSLLGGNVSGVSVTCATSTFTIAGTLSGLASGVQVTLYDNGADPLTLTAGGTFTFATPVAYGGAYDVTIGTQPSGQQCAVSNAAGPSVSSNITTVSVACADTVSYTTPGSYSWTVPAGVTSVQVVAIGGGGGSGGVTGLGPGSPGGAGALVTATLSVTSGQVIALVVGGGGGAGAASPTTSCTGGGGGGGASSIDVGNADQVIAGGGGGGGGCYGPAHGGSGDGAGGAGGAGGADDIGGTGGGGGSGGTGAAGGNPYAGAGGNGSGGPGGAGGMNSGLLPGGAGGSGAGSGTGETDGVNDFAGGGGGGYGGGGCGYYGGGAGAGGSTGPSGTSYSAASNAGASTMSGGDGSIILVPQ